MRKMITPDRKFEHRHVLYCDILGFSEYTLGNSFSKAKCFHLFNQLDSMIEDATTQIDPSAPDPRTGEVPDYIVRPEITYCSDSLVISTPATTIDAIWLCEAAIQIQNGICEQGFLLRGAISSGDVYHSGNTIFGPAIVKAARIEKLVPPVIAISNETYEIFHQAHSPEDKEIVEIRSNQIISKDDCEFYYLDPLRRAKLFYTAESLNVITVARIGYWKTIILKGLDHPDPSVFNKYQWLARHFNRSFEGKAQLVSPISHPKFQ
jgi:hypothetical protein